MPMGGVVRPSDASVSRVCIHDLKNGDFSGQIFNPYFSEASAFQNVAELLSGLETIMDILNFPQSFVSQRTFSSTPPSPLPKKRSMIRHMDEQVFETKVGKQATFIIQVQFRQNATWQGTITWSEQKKSQHFRSTLEMIQLMNDALEQIRAEEENFASWEA